MESDQRFSAIQRDPRFRLMSKRERKVKIDKRFTKMFTDRNFKLKYTVDKRGRPVDLTSSDHLQRYYELSSSEHGSSDEEDATVIQSSSNEKDAGRPSRERPITAKASGKPVPPTELKQSQPKKQSGAEPKKQSGAARVVDDCKPSKMKNTRVENTSSEGLQKCFKRSGMVTPSSAAKKPVTSQQPERSSGEASKGSGHRSVGANDAGHIETTESSPEEGISSEEETEEDESEEEEEDDVDDGGSETDDEIPEDSTDNPHAAPDRSTSVRKKTRDQRKLAGEGSDIESSGHDRKRAKLLTADGPDYARGEGALSSSDSDSDDSFYDDSAMGEEAVAHDDHYWGEIDKEADAVEDPTTRLAVCNMDWDRIKAVDLMVLLNSFKPTDGVIKSVKIYPSDYGLERMKEEELSGPKELNAAGAILSKDEANLSQKEIEKKQTEWLRLYQLNRLKYYYAVVECDSTATASHIYEQCDGLEYESSSTKLDLRFIPENMTFDDREATCEASSLSDLSSYKPSLFINTALNQSKVDCTWDETNKDRLMVTNRKFKKEEIEAMDLKVYSFVASSSESGGESDGDNDNDTDKQNGKTSCGKKNKKRSAVTNTALAETDSQEDDDEDAALNKYRSLLQEIEQKELGSRGRDGVEMEITWEPGLKDDTEALVEHKVAEADGITVWDKYLEKRRDKKKQKFEQKKLAKVQSEEAEGDSSLLKQHSKGKKMKGKAEPQLDEKEAKERAELSLLVGSDEDKKHFSMKKIISQENLSKKKKKKAKKTDTADNFEVDLNDPRFSAVYTSHLYNIDPSAQEFKKTKASMAIIEEKLKRRAQFGQDGARPLQPASKPAVAGSDPSLAMLVKSVKAKAKNFKQQKMA